MRVLLRWTVTHRLVSAWLVVSGFLALIIIVSLLFLDSVLALPTNSSPLASSNSTLTHRARPIQILLTAQDADNDKLTFHLVKGPAHGMLSITKKSSQSATARYSPLPGFVGADSFRFRFYDGEAFSNTATMSVLVTPKFVPWLEVNLPDELASIMATPQQGALPGVTIYDFALQGLSHWAQVTDQVIITTIPGVVEYLYPPLMADRPAGLQIIPGVKTSPLLYGDFADPAGWATIAEEATRAIQITGTNEFLAENESALWDFHHHGETINYTALQNSLPALRNTGANILLWLPQIFNNSSIFPNALQETTSFVNAFQQALPNVEFVTQYVAQYYYQPSNIALRQTMIDTVGLESVFETLWTRADGYWPSPDGPWRAYTPAEAIAASYNLPTSRVNIYPGADWILVAQQFAAQLPHIGPRANLLRPPILKSALPRSGYIDIQQDQGPQGESQGLQEIRATFNQHLYDPQTGRDLRAANIIVRQTGSLPPPQVTSVRRSGNTYTISLSRPISSGEYTTIRFQAINADSVPLPNTNANKLTYGFLPGDVNRDGITNASDIPSLTQFLQGNRGLQQPMDINRDGVVTPIDILRLIDLLNGVNTSHVWNGVTLPTSPPR